MRVGRQRLDIGPGLDLESAGPGLVLAVHVGPRGSRRSGALDELAEVAEAAPSRQCIVPEKATGGVGQRVAPLVGIAARKAAEGPLQVIGDVGLVHPLMAVGAQDAAA